MKTFFEKNNFNVIKKPNFIYLFNKHPFHVLSPSVLPFVASFFITSFLMSQVFWWNATFPSNIVFLNKTQMHLSFMGFIYTLFFWIFLILKESAEGNHTKEVQKGLKMGFYLFLITEIMLFFSFFWTYFWFSLNASFLAGSVWPPFKTQEINAFELPLFNTIILLLSGYTITLAHRKILTLNFGNNLFIKNITNKYLLLTILLGLFFLLSQKIEYTLGLKYIWSTNVFWSCFFLLTGFHGAHVLVGTLLLIFNYLRISLSKNYFFSKKLGAPMLITIYYYKTVLLNTINTFILKYFFFKRLYKF